MNATLEKPVKEDGRTAVGTAKPKVWVVADTHFNHGNVISYENRPFASKEEMNEEIIKRWNETVAPEDTVYHLGDVIFGGRAVKDSILPRLNGYKILRLGNHDYRTTKSQWGKFFDEVYDEDILLGDLCLSHYPLTDYEMERLLAVGLIKGNVHGHVHSQIGDLDQTKYKCVSVELTNYRPVLLDDIKKHFQVEG